MKPLGWDRRVWQGLLSVGVALAAACGTAPDRRALEVLRSPTATEAERLQAVRALVRAVQLAGPGPADAGTRRLQTLRAMLDDPSPDVRAAAAVGLAWVGTDADRATPVLLDAFADPDVRSLQRAARRMATQLDRLEFDRAIELIERTFGTSESAVWGATRPRQRSERASALAALRSTDAEARARAAWTLGSLGRGATEAVDALAAALDDPAPAVRRWAAWALGRVGPDAWPAALQLGRHLNDPDSDVRFHAAWALGEIAPESDDALLVAGRSLGAVDEATRRVAAPAFLRRQFDDPTRRLIRGVGSDDDPPVRAAAARALGRLLSLDAQELIVSKLIRLLEDPSPHVRAAAAAGLGAAVRANRLAVRALTQAVQDADPMVRAAARLALAEGRPDASLRDRLAAGLGDSAAAVRAASLMAMGRLGPSGRRTPPTTLDAARLALQDPDPQLRLAAVRALDLLQLSSDVVKPLLAPALRDASPEVRAAAAGALGALGPQAADLAPLLLTQLRVSDPEERLAAARALAATGGDVLAGMGLDWASLASAIESVLADEAPPAFAESPPRPVWDESTILDEAWRQWQPIDAAEACFVALARAGDRARPAGAVLLRLAADPAQPTRRRVLAVGALAAIGVLPMRQVPWAEVLTRDPSAVRVEAAAALGWLGTPDAAVCDALRTTALDASQPEAVRAAAWSVLARASRPDERDRAALAAAAQDSSPWLRDAAERVRRAWARDASGSERRTTN